MCTETFLHLPEEKRRRILDAAWTEFTTAPFSSVSINRIVWRAKIPRGSFYQYFDGKSDIFVCLIKNARAEMMQTMSGLVKQVQGDIFRVTVSAYDLFLQGYQENSMPMLNRLFQMIKINPGIDLENMFTEPAEEIITETVIKELDLSALRRKDVHFVEQVITLTGMMFGGALMNSLQHPEQATEIRGNLLDCLDIIRRGSVRTELLQEGDLSQ